MRRPGDDHAGDGITDTVDRIEREPDVDGGATGVSGRDTEPHS